MTYKELFGEYWFDVYKSFIDELYNGNLHPRDYKSADDVIQYWVSKEVVSTLPTEEDLDLESYKIFYKILYQEINSRLN